MLWPRLENSRPTLQESKDETSNQCQSQIAEREVDMTTLSYGKGAFKDDTLLKCRDGALL